MLHPFLTQTLIIYYFIQEPLRMQNMNSKAQQVQPAQSHT